MDMLDYPADAATVLLMSEPGSLILVLVATIAASSDHSSWLSGAGL